MADNKVDETTENTNIETDFLTELKEFALTVGEECPEGHRRDPASGACLPMGSTDHTAFTRSVNNDEGDLWRGLKDKSEEQPSAQETALLDASEMDEPESCGEGTTFSFVQRRCVSVEEAENENSEMFARNESGDPVEEDVPVETVEPQEIILTSSEEGSVEDDKTCPPDSIYNYASKACVSLSKEVVELSDLDEEFKKAVATYANIAVTSPDPLDGHQHVATLDMDGNGITSIAFLYFGGSHPHSHDVSKFEVKDHKGEEYVSKHPGVAVPIEHKISPLGGDHDCMGENTAAEEDEAAAKLSTPQRKALPYSAFCVPGKRKFPLDTCARVRNAMSRFNQAKDLTVGEKASLRRKILTRAKACDIEVKNFAKAFTEEEFTEVTRLLVLQEAVEARYSDTSAKDDKKSKDDKKKSPCPPFLSWDPESKKCIKAKAFYEQFAGPPSPPETEVSESAENKNPANREGLTDAPDGKEKHPTDCPAGTAWDGILKVCKELDSSKKIKPGNTDIDPMRHASVSDMTVAKVISILDEVIEGASGHREKSKTHAKDLPNEAFPPSLVGPTKRSLMHHFPEVADAYDNDTVDVSRLRNALSKVTAIEGYAEKAVADAQDHLLFHARELVKGYLEKKD